MSYREKTRDRSNTHRKAPGSCYGIYGKRLSPICRKTPYIWTKEGENNHNHIEIYGSLLITSKRKIVTRGAKSHAGKKSRQRNRRKKIEIPLCDVEFKSMWKTGPIIVGIMDRLPMKDISLPFGNDEGTRTTFPWKRTKLNATNGRDRTKMRKNLS